jgi:hypothetical protein
MPASFVVPVAYDWRLLPASMAGYYDTADEILVGIDVNRRTWAGTAFDLPRDELRAELPDPDGKIRIIEGDFYDPGRTPIENDCREREYLARESRNDMVIEVDADESVDGAALVAAAEQMPPGRQLYAPWLQVFKVIGDTALLVDNTHGGELCALATRSRSRRYARQTGEPPVVADLQVLHNTMGRSDAEVAQKLAGWGHAHQVRPGFLDLWRSVSLENYRNARDFHPFSPKRWPALKVTPLASLPLNSENLAQ